MKNVELEAMCLAIRGGATLAEACRETGLNYDATRQRIHQAARGKGRPRDYLIRRKVSDAAAEFGNTARGIIMDAARDGKGPALSEALRRLERLTVDLKPVPEPPTGERAFLKWRLTQLNEWMQTDGATARTKYLALQDDCRRKLAALDEEGDLTHDDACELIEADAPSWSDRQVQIIIDEAKRRGMPLV